VYVYPSAYFFVCKAGIIRTRQSRELAIYSRKWDSTPCFFAGRPFLLSQTGRWIPHRASIVDQDLCQLRMQDDGSLLSSPVQVLRSSFPPSLLEARMMLFCDSKGPLQQTLRPVAKRVNNQFALKGLLASQTVLSISGIRSRASSIREGGKKTQTLNINLLCNVRNTV
jgi:hypothetical protein